MTCRLIARPITTLRTLALLPILLLGTWGCDNRQEEVVGSIRELSRAVASRDGERALSLYSRSTVEYFDEVVRQGRDSTRKQVASLPPLEQLEILCMRHRATPAELR